MEHSIMPKKHTNKIDEKLHQIKAENNKQKQQVIKRPINNYYILFNK